MLKLARQTGFTIIEMATVIVVMGVLALIVTTAYQNYDKNAKTSQISATVESYKGALKTGVVVETDTTPSEAYLQNGDFLAACVSSNTERCCFYFYLYQDTMCKNNAELKSDGLLATDYTYDIVQKYVSDKKAQLPNFTNWGTLEKCNSGSDNVLSFEPPCYSNQVTYTTGLLTTNGKGYLEYYLPGNYDSCYSKDIVSYASVGAAGQLSGAPYTYRVATGAKPYTMCIVQL